MFPPSGEPVGDHDAAPAYMSSYALRGRFFDQSEGAFYWALRKALRNRYLIFAKVRLLDVCDDIPRNDRAALNRIWARHVDFLLCDKFSFQPIAAIEVDGTSHERQDRMRRDVFMKELFERIGLPLIRVPAKRWFEPAEVVSLVDDALS